MQVSLGSYRATYNLAPAKLSDIQMMYETQRSDAPTKLKWCLERKDASGGGGRQAGCRKKMASRSKLARTSP